MAADLERFQRPDNALWVRIDSALPQGNGSMIARAEQGRFDASGKWLMERNWNGDQVDWGLNLPAHPTVLKVRMGRY